jgi:hypothetical protein
MAADCGQRRKAPAVASGFRRSYDDREETGNSAVAFGSWIDGDPVGTEKLVAMVKSASVAPPE